MVKRSAAIAFAMALLLSLAGHARADVTASVDRPDVELNESFTLEIVVDSTARMEPDLAPLEQDFYVGQSSQITNTTIVNGQITRSQTWSVALMAKRAGTLEIPSIAIGNEQSDPIPIRVREPTYEPPGEADVFITAEIDRDEAYVQAQVLYRIKVYRAVPTRQPALRNPTFGGAEALIEDAGDERTYEAILNGRAYNVVERVIAIFPQESGEITISPTRFEARVLRDGRITGRKMFDSEPHTITVQPIPAPPPDYPQAAWLPALDLELTESWSRDVDELTAGEPVTRNVSISVLGQLETQIPGLDPPVVPGINVYPDKPEMTRRLEADGIRGIRRDEYAIIGVDPGTVSLPAVELPWWDLEAGEWRVAKLPGRRFEVVAGTVPPPAIVDAPEPARADVEPQAPQAAPASTPFWRRVSEILAAVWLLTLGAWWWSSRPAPDSRREPAPVVPAHKQQARALKSARRAALAGDDRGLRQALLEWADLEWPDNAPRSIGAVAGRVSEPLAGELRRLSGASYGPDGNDWDGEALAKALRSFSVVGGSSRAAARDGLPPLMPST